MTTHRITEGIFIYFLAGFNNIIIEETYGSFFIRNRLQRLAPSPMSGRRRGNSVHDPIDFRLLRYFLAVRDTGSFRRAAAQTGVSQPNISAQICRLEKSLKAKLLQRGGPRVFVSPTGQVFCQYTLNIIRLTEEFRLRLSTPPEHVRGRLRIGVAPPLNIAAIPFLLGEFCKTHQNVDIMVEESNALAVELALEEGRIDIGLGLAATHSRHLRSEVLAKDRLAWVVHKSHPWAKKDSVQLTDLDGQRIVAMPERFLIRRLTDQILREHRVRPRIVAEIGTVSTLLKMLAPLQAGALMPRVALYAAENVTALPLRGGSATLEIRLCTAVGPCTQGLVEDFAKLARDVVPRLAAKTVGCSFPEPV